MGSEQIIVAGTGHRPKFMPCQYNESHEWAVKTKAKIRKWLEENRPAAVISGMAIGFDTWLAEITIELGIPVWSYIPFEGQGENWPWEAKLRYKKILKSATKTKVICAQYTKEAFFLRDEAMVDHANLVVALWNPEITSGGTYHTVQYAKKKGRSVVNFWED